MLVLTVFGDRPISVMIVVEVKVSISVPFSFKDGDPWMGVTGSNNLGS